jgi:hypothetical protein
LVCHHVVFCTVGRKALQGSSSPLEALELLAKVLKHFALMRRAPTDIKVWSKPLQRSLRIVRSTKALIELRNGFDASLADFERDRAKHLHPQKGDAEKDKRLWPAWSSNTVRVGSDTQRAAIVRKADFKAIASYLPRGGVAILDNWRMDVEELVDSILEVSEGYNWCAVH